MIHEKKLAFIAKMTKMGLEHIPHFDIGGTVAAPGVGGPGASANPTGGNMNTGNPISNALGLNNAFQAGAANIQQGTNAGQINNAYTGAQSALTGQETLANALGAQAPGAVTNQQMLAQQYANQAQGLGPNVAQAQLNQATGQNIAQQAALAAGQRGAGTNAGLIARENAQQGAATQQQAAGQAATLGAQQQIAAQQNLANLSANQINQAGTGVNNLSQAAQNEQKILQGANTAYNNAIVGMQSNLNNVNAQTAAQNQQTSSGIIGGLLGGASSILGKFADGGSVGPNIEPTKPFPAPQKSGSDLSSVAPVIAEVAMMAANGGKVPNYESHLQKFASGGSPIVGNPLVGGGNSGAVSFAGQFLNSQQSSAGPNVAATPSFGAHQSQGKSTYEQGQQLGNAADNAFENYQYNNALNEGMNEIDQENAGKEMAGGQEDPFTMAACGGEMGKRSLDAKGGKVKANGKDEKATVKGNSYDNDKVPALLSEGEIVIPRSITMHDRAPELAAEFVRRTLAKKGQLPKRGAK